MGGINEVRFAVFFSTRCTAAASALLPPHIWRWSLDIFSSTNCFWIFSFLLIINCRMIMNKKWAFTYWCKTFCSMDQSSALQDQQSRQRCSENAAFSTFPIPCSTIWARELKAVELHPSRCGCQLGLLAIWHQDERSQPRSSSSDCGCCRVNYVRYRRLNPVGVRGSANEIWRE